MSDFQRMNIPEKRSSLADMARAAARRSSQPPPSEAASGLLDIHGGGVPRASAPPPPPTARPSSVAQSDDSGLIDLKALRPQPPAPLPIKPSAVNALDTLNPASVSVAPPSPFDVNLKQALSDPTPSFSKDEIGRPNRRMFPIAAAMLLATTAGIAGTYFMTRGHAAQPTAAVQTPSGGERPAGQAAAAQDKAPAAEQANPAAAPNSPAAAAPVADPEQNINAAPDGKGAAERGAPVHGGAHSRVSSKGGAPAAVAAAAPAPEKQDRQDKKTSDKLAAELAKEAPASKAADTPKAIGGDPLAGAIQKAAGPIAKSEAVVVDKGPASQNSDLPEQPGKGAISGALSGPRGVAKTCLDGHNAPASVSVVFGSDGKVQTVNVTGAGAATDCVKKAFGRANVGQFRRATFPVSVTITPP